MMGINLFYMNGNEIWANTSNASAVPRVGDFVVMNGLKAVVKEVVWHLENQTWVEIQVKRV